MEVEHLRDGIRMVGILEYVERKGIHGSYLT